MYVCMLMYVCIDVCMLRYVCMYVCTVYSVCYVCMYVCMYVMYVCIYIYYKIAECNSREWRMHAHLTCVRSFYFSKFYSKQDGMHKLRAVKQVIFNL